MSTAMLDAPNHVERNGCGDALEEAPGAGTPTEEVAVDIQPNQPNRWQAPLSLAQGVLALIVGTVSLLGYGFAFHTRFVTIELNAARQAEDLKTIRVEMSDRSKSDAEKWEKLADKLDSSMLMLTSLKEKNEWMAAWIRQGGEQKK